MEETLVAKVQVVAKGTLVSIRQKLKKALKGFVFDGPATIVLTGKVYITKSKPRKS